MNCSLLISTKPILALIIILLASSYSYSQDSWKLKKNEDGIKVWTAEQEGSDFKSFKVETTINNSLDVVYKYLMDIDKFQEYYDMLADVVNINHINNKEAQYILEFDFPWPLKKRRTWMNRKAYPVESGSYEIHFTSKNLEDKKPGFVNVVQNESIFTLINAGNDKTLVRSSGFMDPGGIIPARIANFKIVDGPFSSFEKLKKILDQ